MHDVAAEPQQLSRFILICREVETGSTGTMQKVLLSLYTSVIWVGAAKEGLGGG